MTINTQKTVIVLSGFTGPTGTFEQVNIIPNFTGPTGLYPQWSAYTGPTGASGQKGNNKSVINIGPTGPSFLSPGKGIKTVIIPGFAGGGGGASTIWNAADSTTPTDTMTLSALNLKATHSAGAGTGGIRSTNPKTAGKLYAEITANSIGFRAGGGVSNASGLLNNVRFGSLNQLFINEGGAMNSGNSTLATGVHGFVTSGVAQFAIDFTAKLAWCRMAADATWNNSGTANPATGVGGFDVSGIISTGLMLFFGTENTPDAATINVGGSAFTGSVPTGFAAWG